MNATKRILIVDDEPYLRSLLKSLLEPMYRVTAAGSGAEALQLSKDAPDLMIIDVLMPGMSGLELCRQLRARDADGVPIIMLTALDDDEIRDKCVAVGASDLFRKPFHPDDLVARVGNWIDA